MIDSPVSYHLYLYKKKANTVIENCWDRRIVPDNEYYDSDEGEAQGAGGNVKSGHERNYNDDDIDSKEGTPMDVKMSQEEEDEIADALNEEPIKQEDRHQTVTDSEDVIMTGNDSIFIFM